jgi:hypothetical protein
VEDCRKCQTASATPAERLARAVERPDVACASAHVELLDLGALNAFSRPTAATAGPRACLPSIAQRQRNNSNKYGCRWRTGGGNMVDFYQEIGKCFLIAINSGANYQCWRSSIF